MNDDVCVLLKLASSVSDTQLADHFSNLTLVKSLSNCTINHCISNQDFTTNNPDCISNHVFSDSQFENKHNGIDCCFECIRSYYSDFNSTLLSKYNTGNMDNINSIKSSLSISNRVFNNSVNNGSTNNASNSVKSKTVDDNNVSYLGQRVVNLSDYQLNKSQKSLLEKGITFVPTPGDADIADIHLEVNKFIRRILLKLHFHDEGNNDNQQWKNQLPPSLVKFKKPSTWTPRTRDPFVHGFVQNVHKSMIDIKTTCRESHNLTNEERDNLEILRSNDKIVIKKADKGSSIVIMNRSDYVKEAERQLSDPKFYKEMKHDLTIEHQKEVDKVIDHLLSQEYIDELTSTCLKNTNPKTSALYLLPKIHKIKKRGEFPAGRPIISANGSPTERISAFVDDNIKGAVPLLPSFIKDTTDFIHKIENIVVPDSCLLVTLDVTSLYTNIPNMEGIKAVSQSLKTHKPPYCPSRGVLLLLWEVLTKNNFTFNGKNYLQVGGTAMGTKLAPSYANIFMGNLEQKLIKNYHLKPLLWLRFIDDVFALWTHGQPELDRFLEYLNKSHTSIKFTMEFSDEKIVFLDTIVKKSQFRQKLLVELYTKPTDTHNYLHFNSFHPSHTKRGGPYGQFLRVRRNCTLLSDYDKHSLYLKEKYLQRGYPISLIEGSRIRARSQDRSALLSPNRINPKTTKTDNVLPLVLTYHPSNHLVKKIIMDNWGILKYSPLCRDALPEKPLFATRRNTNLKDILIKSRLDPSKPSNTTGHPNLKAPCKFWNCSVCINLKKLKSFRSEQNNKSYKTPPNVQCRTPNVVYLLTCNICQKQYIGETKRPFIARLKEHLADVRFKRDKPVALHMNSHRSDNIKIIPQIIEVIHRDPNKPETTELRKKREIYWIYRLRTLIPHGLNSLG